MPAAALFRFLAFSLVMLRIAAASDHRSAAAQNQSRFSSVEHPSHMRSRRFLLGTDRISDECTKSDISIFQGRSSPLPNGIPTYTVQIINLCVVGCPLSNIHVSCGWFASAKLVNPKTFRRLGFNDCLVNDGKPVSGGESVFFHYANSFQYPMKVDSAVACSGGV